MTTPSAHSIPLVMIGDADAPACAGDICENPSFNYENTMKGTAA